MPLVRIYETQDVGEALIIRATLDAYGILATLDGLELAHQLAFALPPLTTVRVMVSDQDEETARLLLG